MIFEYRPHKGFNYMEEFAKRFNLSYSGNYMEFNAPLGDGFMKTIDIAEGFRIVLNKIDYKKTIVIKKQETDYPDDLVVFRFIYIIAPERDYLSNVQVVNNMVNTEDVMDMNTSVCHVAISIKAGLLLNLMDLGQDMKELASFISNFTKPFLYQEIITPEMKNIIRDLFKHTSHDKLEKFYYKTKISELIYAFFSRFLRRDSFDFGSINRRDIEKILQIEKIILKDLSKAPVLPELARSIGMSETKMKSLFKKIFEDSIYNYYSSARMIEAAILLKNNENIPVSEVGYSLGFSNLSHFSKMFKRYTGMNPKEYAMVVKGRRIT